MINFFIRDEIIWAVGHLLSVGHVGKEETQKCANKMIVQNYRQVGYHRNRVYVQPHFGSFRFPNLDDSVLQ
jgi:hypothetical protein